jgi:outer membrane protein TolC
MADMLRRLLLAAALLLPSPAWAQDPLTLREAVRLSLANNPAMRAARAGEEEAESRGRQARAAFLPRIDLIESWQRGNQPVFVFGSLLSQRRFSEADFAIAALNQPDALSNHRAAIAVEQTLFDGARSGAELSGSRLSADIARLEARRTALDLADETVRAYGRTLAAAANLAAARASVDSAAEDLRRAEERQRVGVETGAAVLALRVEHAEAGVRRIRAAAEADIARAALNVVIGAAVGDARPLAPLEDLPPAAGDLAALEASALADRPELQQAALRVRLAETQIKAARSGYLPHVSAQAGFEANGRSIGDRAGTWTTGVQLRWNVFAGGADAARVATATAARARASADRERVEQAVKLDVRQALATHASAVARRALGQAIVDQAVESRRIIRERYDAGLASASDLTRATELVLRAEATRIAALVDLHTSAAAIDRAAGRIETPK